MADAIESVQSKPAIPMMTLMTSVLVAVVAVTGVLGGAGWWLIRSGRLPVGPGAASKDVAKQEPEKTKLVGLEPLLVNLADADGRSYLRVAITLREEAVGAKGEKAAEPSKGKAIPEDEADLRDAALDVLGRQTSTDLLAADGKQHLKTELREAIAKRVPEAKVKEVLFTEFLVQQ